MICPICNQEITRAERNELRDHQAEAWCLLVTDLIEDFGLDYTEPGKVACDQVRNFVRRKLESRPAPASAEQQETKKAYLRCADFAKTEHLRLGRTNYTGAIEALMNCHSQYSDWAAQIAPPVTNECVTEGCEQFAAQITERKDAMTRPRRIHAIPIGDLEVHSAQAICWCHPTEIEPFVWVHNAEDCREAKERVTGTKCSNGWINIAEYPSQHCDYFLFQGAPQKERTGE